MSERFRARCGFAAVALFLSGSVGSAEPVKVGEKAPGFELKDQAGDAVSLEGLLKKKPVALVFYRSADW